ncbi:MAG: 50S ribosomal protein L7/L12 [Ruminococcus sp.]|jgi:large subunit ribosomal protein L7/L12|nr:50S ribosomal protein L7/L12 [Ruminococcus sp.]
MASEKITQMIEDIKAMSVLELSDLVTAIQDEFGVTAVIAAAGAGAAAPVAEEKTEFNVCLKSFGDKKMDIIKAVKDLFGLSLKEAKEAVEAAPKVLKEAVAKADAEELKKKLEEKGATVELQ